MQAAGHLVKVLEARSYPGQHALPLVVVFNCVYRLVHELLDGARAVLHPLLTDSQHVTLHFVEQSIHFAFVLINPPHHLRAGLNHAPQQVFFPDDVGVVTQVGRRRHGVRQGREISQPAHGFELVPVFEALLDREQVNRLPVIVHLDQ